MSGLLSPTPSPAQPSLQLQGPRGGSGGRPSQARLDPRQVPALSSGGVASVGHVGRRGGAGRGTEGAQERAVLAGVAGGVPAGPTARTQLPAASRQPLPPLSVRPGQRPATAPAQRQSCSPKAVIALRGVNITSHPMREAGPGPPAGGGRSPAPALRPPPQLPSSSQTPPGGATTTSTAHGIGPSSLPPFSELLLIQQSPRKGPHLLQSQPMWRMCSLHSP